MTYSKALFYFCLSFLFGVFLQSIFKTPQFIIWGVLVIALLIIFLSFFLKKELGFIGFCILCILIGILRMQISEFNILNDQLRTLNDKGGIVLKGLISDEPELRDKSQILKIKVFSSTMLAITKRYPEYHYLDEVEISGQLKTPDNDIDGFNYKNYLMKDHIYSVISFPRIEVISKKNPNFLEKSYSLILSLKQTLRQSIERVYLPPSSSILKAMILGDRGALSSDLKEKLSFSGLTHIVAISGSHIVIFSALLMYLLLGLGFNRNNTFYFILISIIMYVILTGLPSSGIRAMIMAIVYLIGQKLGRQAGNSRIIFLAAALMCFHNPFLLVYDIGFQLSFLAVLGLAYLDPLIQAFSGIFLKRLFQIQAKGKVKFFLSMVSATLSAQIFTLPIIIYNFGNIPLFSPISNIMTLPIIPLIMIFGFLSAIFGILSFTLGWIISLSCHILISYFVFIAELFSRPFAYEIIENISFVWLLILYFLIYLFVRFLNRKYREKLL